MSAQRYRGHTQKQYAEVWKVIIFTALIFFHFRHSVISAVRQRMLLKFGMKTRSWCKL